MRRLGTSPHLLVMELTKERDGFDGLACMDRKEQMHKGWHQEKEDGERFLNHLYDHRLLHNQDVPQSAIDEVHQRLRAGRRYRRDHNT